MKITREDLFAYIGGRCSAEKAQEIRRLLQDPSTAVCRFFDTLCGTGSIAGFDDDDAIFEQGLGVEGSSVASSSRSEMNAARISSVIKDALLLGFSGEHVRELQCARNDCLLRDDVQSAIEHIRVFYEGIRHCMEALQPSTEALQPVVECGPLIFFGASEDSDSSERPADSLR